MLRQGGRWKDPGQSRPSLASASLQWTALGQTRCRTDPRRQGNAWTGTLTAGTPSLDPGWGLVDVAGTFPSNPQGHRGTRSPFLEGRQWAVS